MEAILRESLHYLPHMLKHSYIPSETLEADPGQDVTLTALLLSYEALYLCSVLTNIRKTRVPLVQQDSSLTQRR